jgi:hypothetical protein
MSIVSDYNLAAGMVNAYAKYFDAQEKRLNGLINNMSKSNIEIKILSDVMNKLAHAKKTDKKADFSNDEMMKRYIVHIHKNNPTIFDGYIHGFPAHIPDDEGKDGDDGEISLEEMLERSLKNIDLGKITFDVFGEAEIDVLTQGIDSELKMHSADLNEFLMKINNIYDEKSHMTESARDVVNQTRELLASINRRMSPRG